MRGSPGEAQEPADSSRDLPDSERLPRIPGFEVQSELGRGAMGVVYLATQTALRRPVALKLLREQFGIDAPAVARRRWLREARAISSARHPNVVPLYDFGEADGWFFLVLEYIPGGSLKERLAGPLPPRIAATLLETIGRAVAYIHTRGMLHLDLKPSNILLDGDESASWDRAIPRVSDFGLALIADPDACETTLAGPRGTPPYMAPEQTDAGRERIGPATDIYALGAVLYELLTGRLPFLGTSPIETLSQVRDQEPVSPRRLNPAIPRDLETICLTCLQKDPGRRYATADAMTDDLRRWLGGCPISARPVSFPEKAWRGCLRRPLVAALALSLVLTLSAGFLSTLLLWRFAEAALARAEADYQVGRAALAEILDLGEKSIEPTVVVTRERVIASLQAARGRIVELTRRRPNDPETWNLMALVDLFLGRNLEYRNQWVEGESLYLESLMYWDKILARTSGELAPMYRRWQTLQCLARVLEQEGRWVESTRHWERAIAAGEKVLGLMPDPDFNSMAECRISLAKLLDRQGHRDRAAAVLDSNLRMLREVPAKSANPVVAARITETRTELGSILPDLGPLSGEDWARYVTGFLHLLSGIEKRDPAEEAEAGYVFQRLLSEKASSRRRAGKFNEARRTAERMHAFAKLLVSTYPHHSASHLALNEAYRQSAKDAWESKDRSAVERNWKLAVEESRQALSCDPEDARARGELTAAQQRLQRLHPLALH